MLNQYQAPGVNLNKRYFRPDENTYQTFLMFRYMLERAELIQWLQDTRYFESPVIRTTIRRRLYDVSNRLRELYRECA